MFIFFRHALHTGFCHVFPIAFRSEDRTWTHSTGFESAFSASGICVTHQGIIGDERDVVNLIQWSEMWTLAIIRSNIDSNNLVPSFAGVDARMHIHRPGSGLRLDPAAQSGTQRPRGGGPAASHGQGAGGRAEERWPGASAVGDCLVNFVRSRFRLWLFPPLQGEMSLPYGLPEAKLRCTWQLPVPTATWRWWSSWWRWRRWGCKTTVAGGLSCRVPVDLWPWRFVVGFTWWQFEFKMQIKLHVFCKGNIHVL